MNDTIPVPEEDGFLADGWTVGVVSSSSGSSSKSSTSRSSPSGKLNSIARVFLAGESASAGSSSLRVGTGAADADALGLVTSSPSSGLMETVGGGGTSLFLTSGRSAISNPDDVSCNGSEWKIMKWEMSEYRCDFQSKTVRQSVIALKNATFPVNTNTNTGIPIKKTLIHIRTI